MRNENIVFEKLKKEIKKLTLYYSNSYYTPYLSPQILEKTHDEDFINDVTDYIYDYLYKDFYEYCYWWMDMHADNWEFDGNGWDEGLTAEEQNNIIDGVIAGYRKCKKDRFKKKGIDSIKSFYGLVEKFDCLNFLSDKDMEEIVENCYNESESKYFEEE